MKHGLVFFQAFLLLANLKLFEMTRNDREKIVVGVLMDNNYLYGELESILNFAWSHVEINSSIIPMNQTGGLLENIDHFRSNKARVIFDFQRNNDDAETLAEYLRVPVITTAPQSKPQGEFVVAMYPSITVINSAIVELLLRYKIVDVLLLYDRRRSRQATNLHTKCQRNYIKIEMMPELHLDNMEMIKDAIRMAWKTQIKTAVLLCDTKDIKTVVEASLRSRLYDKDRNDWKWIVSDMDFKKPDYDPLDGFVGFSLPDPRRRTKDKRILTILDGQVLTNVFYAAAIDAGRLVNAALQRLNQTSLKNPEPGKVILQAIKNVDLPPCKLDTKDMQCGLTGIIKFDENGERKIDELDFVTINEQRLVREGSCNLDLKNCSFPPADKVRWVGDVVANYLCHEKRDKEPMKSEKRNFTIMIQRSDPPFVFVNESKPSPENYQGFSIDIVRELAKMMDFDYHFVVLDKGGSGKKIGGEWNGLVGALINEKADIAIGSFTITAQREEVIDFSKPFMDFRTALILRIPEEKESLFNFHKPFSTEIWLMVVLTVFGMTFLLYGVDYFSPLGYRKTAEDVGEGEEFNIMNSLWFATASMLQQGGDNTPKAPSGRILAAAFWFFILIIISTYTANLAAFFTNKKIESPIKDLEDLVYRSKIKYGVLKNGQLYNFLQTSNSSIHRKMFSHITEKRTSMTSSKIGVQKASEGGYAYITDTPILEYWSNQKPCNTLLVKNLFEVKSYGFGLPKNSEYTNEISVAILKLREQGFIERRRKYWWEQKSQCTPHEPASATVTLGLHSLGGVFIVMIGGSIISFILLAIEIKFKWIIDLIMKAQENNSGNEEQRSETVMRVEISQGERTLNPINHEEPPKKRWFPSFGFKR